jgi:hypothetical protein
MVISINTSKQYMEERSTYAGNVITKQLQRVVSVNTSEQYMMERSTHAGNVTTRQLNTSKALLFRSFILTHSSATVYFIVVTAQPQPQPNSTLTQVGVDKVISWSTPPPPPPPHHHPSSTFKQLPD